MASSGSDPSITVKGSYIIWLYRLYGLAERHPLAVALLCLAGALAVSISIVEWTVIQNHWPFQQDHLRRSIWLPVTQSIYLWPLLWSQLLMSALPLVRYLLGRWSSSAEVTVEQEHQKRGEKVLSGVALVLMLFSLLYLVGSGILNNPRYDRELEDIGLVQLGIYLLALLPLIYVSLAWPIIQKTKMVQEAGQWTKQRMNPKWKLNRVNTEQKAIPFCDNDDEEIEGRLYGVCRLDNLESEEPSNKSCDLLLLFQPTYGSAETSLAAFSLDGKKQMNYRTEPSNPFARLGHLLQRGHAFYLTHHDSKYQLHRTPVSCQDSIDGGDIISTDLNLSEGEIMKHMLVENHQVENSDGLYLVASDRLYFWGSSDNAGVRHIEIQPASDMLEVVSLLIPQYLFCRVKLQPDSPGYSLRLLHVECLGAERCLQIDNRITLPCKDRTYTHIQDAVVYPPVSGKARNFSLTGHYLLVLYQEEGEWYVEGFFSGGIPNHQKKFSEKVPMMKDAVALYVSASGEIYVVGRGQRHDEVKQIICLVRLKHRLSPS